MKYLDLSYVNHLSGGDTELVNELIDLFLNSAPSYAAEIRKNFTGENWQETAAIAHKFKSAAQYIGFKKLAQLLNTIEQNSEEQIDTKILSELIAKMNIVLDASINELNQYRSKDKS